MNRGSWYAVGAFVAWGLFPVYWKALHQIAPRELICHRILWSYLTLCGIAAVRGSWSRVISAYSSPRIVGLYLAAALLIGANWFVFIWAVSIGNVIESSLGYFINPLLSVLLGVLFFRERLRPGQWTSIALAGAAVVYLTLAYGTFPRIAIALALTFGLYGMVKKIAPLGSIVGMTVETSLLVVPATIYLAWQVRLGEAGFLHVGASTVILLLASGFVTTLPLVLFAAAAQRIPLAQVGILQYIGPTLQFLLGAVAFHERFTPAQLVGFILVWISLAVFGAEGAWFGRANRAAA